MVMSPNGPSHQPTHTQQQTQLDPPQQYLLLGQQATEAQHKNITSQLDHNTRTGSHEGKESSEKSNQPQEVRTSGRTRKQPGKMDTFLWSTR